MPKKAYWLFTAIICLSTLFFCTEAKRPARIPKVEMALDISKVWSGQRIGFCLLTKGNRQFFCFYYHDVRMSFAGSTLDSFDLQFLKFPFSAGWSSHKSVTLAVDDSGYVHLSGNMHSDTLIYYRTSKPYDVQSFLRIPKMIGQNENKCTYPQFVRGPRGEFIFHYRDGSSGKGNEIFNVYDLDSRSWRRLLDKPLFDGEGQRNAYLHGPIIGPDGYYHLSWMWRDDPDCLTNHDLSYARSQDLVHWETIGGQPIDLPITFATKGVIVDPVPVRNGLINISDVIGFDSKKRAVISYHKYDANGKSQAFNARLEDGHWKIYQTSDWDYRWYFYGFGAIQIEISIGPVVLSDEGFLNQTYEHKQYGSGKWTLDENSLKPIEDSHAKAEPLWPEDLLIKESFDPTMQINWQSDAGENDDRNAKYVLRWESLPDNRDRPRSQAPKPSTLRLYKIKYD